MKAEDFKVDESKLFFTYDGKEHYVKENVLAVLLLEGLVFVNDYEVDGGEYTTVIYVNANDVFMWGCADATTITQDELEEFYKMSRNEYGDIKWICKKRNIQPQSPLIKRIKDAGCWDDEFESLPKNIHN